MAKVIPLPTRGQPLDVSFIYDLAEGVNNIAAGLASQKGTVDVKSQTDTSKKSVKTSNATIYAAYAKVITNKKVNANDTFTTEEPFIFNYNFSAPPIVIATPVVDANSLVAGKTASVVVTSVTTSKAEFSVRFADGGDNVTAGLNILVIGIPSV